jgi:hypothetical protein
VAVLKKGEPLNLSLTFLVKEESTHLGNHKSLRSGQHDVLLGGSKVVRKEAPGAKGFRDQRIHDGEVVQHEIGVGSKHLGTHPVEDAEVLLQQLASEVEVLGLIQEPGMPFELEREYPVLQEEELREAIKTSSWMCRFK